MKKGILGKSWRTRHILWYLNGYGFIIFSRKSLGNTFKVTLDGRIQAIQEESQQFPNPNEVVP
ncbi:hypothetical protein KY290_037198 [Solanum tuberosum]|uniref:ATP synthase protein MI25 n=1 Tax=Solanum tuberosum TaxID=4113 RepID=A0ABQ7TVH9_SOLTU|nr:hypothetical protein KY284_036539 [Solanum tuberosum]KAH0738493.1 hypothetical protein KY290_037198 [Solanum tuberosum]